MVLVDRNRANLLDASAASGGTKYYDDHAQHEPYVPPLLLHEPGAGAWMSESR
jgi:hypothetical protein